MKTTLRSLYLAMAVAGVMLIGVLGYSGCQTYQNEQGVTVTRLTDGATETLDMAAELAPVVTTTLVGVSTVFPPLAGLLGILAGSIGAFSAAYKKYRPQLTAEQDKARVYGDTTKAIVYAIEQFKTTNSVDWETLKDDLKYELADKVGPEGKAIIEALIYSYELNSGKYDDEPDTEVQEN
jgi:hypothetical protein